MKKRLSGDCKGISEEMNTITKKQIKMNKQYNTLSDRRKNIACP